MRGRRGPPSGRLQALAADAADDGLAEELGDPALVHDHRQRETSPEDEGTGQAELDRSTS